VALLKYKRIGKTRALSGLPGGNPGFERADSTTLFTLGTFQVSSNLRSAQLPAPGFTPAEPGIIAQHITLADLQVDNLAEARAAQRFQRQLRLPADPAELSGYAYFGSLRLRLRAAVNSVLAAFPAGLVAEPTQPDGSRLSTVITHSYEALADATTCQLPVDTLANPFGLNLHTLAQESRPGQPDLLTQTQRYVLELEGIEYPLLEVVGLTNAQSGLLTVRLKGHPFAAYTTQSLALRYVLRPAAEYARSQFRTTTSELGLYLLGGTQAPLPNTALVVFRLPVEGENFETADPIIEEQQVSWPRPDGYNIASQGVSFSTYVAQLDLLGDALDGYKSDLLLSRYAPPDSLLALDETQQAKLPALLRVWGRQLDDTKLFIDALARVNHLDYEPARSVPEQLVRSLAATLGWQVQPLLDEDQLLERLYSVGLDQAFSSSVSVLPPDLDAELWRRIALNTHWFFRAKGTRLAVESVLNLLGLPNGLLRFDEHAYLLEPQTITTVLADPVTPLGYGDPLDNVPVAAPVYQNVGQVGNYLDSFRTQGKLTRLVDNRKVWVAPTDLERSTGYAQTDLTRHTSYQVPAGARVLPSKEISLSISPARAWDNAFYAYCRQLNGFPGQGLAHAGSLRLRGGFPIPPESAAEFFEKLLQYFIDARSHKTAVSYPTLHGLLLAYEREVGADAVTLRALLAYSRKLNRYWRQLAMQLLPATVIQTQQALTISNPQLVLSKHRYRQGVSVGSEFTQPIATPHEGGLGGAGSRQGGNFTGSRLRSMRAMGTQVDQGAGMVEITGEAHEPLQAIVYAPELTGRVQVGGSAIITSARQLKIKPRAQAVELQLSFPAATTTSAAELTPGTILPPAVVYQFGADAQGKQLVLKVPAQSVLPQAGRVPYALGYRVYEVRTGQTPTLVQSEWFSSDQYTLVADVASVTRLVPLSALLPDREYLVQTYFRKYIQRGAAPEPEQLPYDLAGYFRAVVYPQRYAQVARATTFPTTPYELAITNEHGPLPGTYFEAYRAGTDFYFPTIQLPAKPVLESSVKVAPVEFFTETLTPVNGVVTLTNRALQPPVFYLNGSQLSRDTGQYTSVYPVGHPLENQVFRIAIALESYVELKATYRTAYQQLSVVSETYDMRAITNPYVDVVVGEQPASGVRMFLAGAAGASTPAQAIGFVLAQAPLPDSTSLRINGVAVETSLRDYITRADGTQVRIPGVYFLALSGSEPQRSDQYVLSYGVVDTGRADFFNLTTPVWSLDWTTSDRYAPDLLSQGRVAHVFHIEVAAETDYDFEGEVRLLAMVTIPASTGSSQLRVNAQVPLSSLQPGQLYLMRIHAVKTVQLANETAITYEAIGATYRFKVPGMTAPF
jgi:hypothetical protein